MYTDVSNKGQYIHNIQKLSTLDYLQQKENI